jgi:hypothetical protein
MTISLQEDTQVEIDLIPILALNFDPPPPRDGGQKGLRGQS